MRTPLTRGLALTAIAALTLSFTGCGKKTTELTGTVVYKNKPLPVALIVFQDENGKGASARVFNGQFKISRVPVGENLRVVVSTSSIEKELKRTEEALPFKIPPGTKDRIVTKDMKPPPDRKDDLKDKVDPDMIERVQQIRDTLDKLVPVPARFESEETTPLIVTVKAGQGTIEIVLSD